MSPDKLTYMANQIATFFDSQSKDDAAREVAKHINSFWEPRMRAQLLEMFADDSDHGFKASVSAAQPFIKPPKPAMSPADPGG